MKRSQVNAAIEAAEAFFFSQNFFLPAFSRWSYDDWLQGNEPIDELCNRQLGWDVTDFGSGDFSKVGLTLFTLRNALLGSGNQGKGYAEKIMFVGDGQLTPVHFHHKKTEDIINRGGPGNLVIKVFSSTPTDDLDSTPVDLLCDGRWRQFNSGEEILLRPGDSVTLTPRIYHAFYAVSGSCLVGEVSSRNNDCDDNRFFEPLPRFSTIIEDASPRRLIYSDYSSRLSERLASNGRN